MTADTGVGLAPPDIVRLWVEAISRMSREALGSFERRTFAAWDRASLGALREAIDRRSRELAG